jgi:histidinol-phosphate aminotransferase
MFKYKKTAEKLIPYTIPSTTNYKYKMDIGEWNFPVHPSVTDFITNFTNLCRYGVIDDKFNILLHLIKQYNGLKDDVDSVILTNGSDNALRLILELFATEESKILIPVPSYVHFECVLDTFKVKQVNKPYTDYKLTNEEFNNFILNELSSEYDLCYLVNPSMPIGHLLTHEQIIKMLVLYPNTVFVIDEAYIEFSSALTCACLTEKFDNIIVVRTFSKFFGLASLRLGYLMTNTKIITLLKPYYNYKDISPIAIGCATNSLLNLDFYDKHKETFFELKSFVKNNLELLVKSNEKITDVIMNDGMFFTLICKDPVDLKKYFDNLSIAVRNKDCDIKGAIRMTIDKKEILEYVFNQLLKY